MGHNRDHSLKISCGERPVALYGRYQYAFLLAKIHRKVIVMICRSKVRLQVVKVVQIVFHTFCYRSVPRHPSTRAHPVMADLNMRQL